MTLRDNVARGAAWLDTEAPGWAERIDPSTLDLWSSTYCVAGQLFTTRTLPGYTVMMKRMGALPSDWGRADVAHGFTHPDVETDRDLYADRTDDPRITELRDLWLAQVAIRTQSPEGTP